VRGRRHGHCHCCGADLKPLLRSTASRQICGCGHTGLGASLERSPAATALRCSGFGRTAELATRCALRSDSRSEPEHEARCARRHSPLRCSASQRRPQAGVPAAADLQLHCWRATGGVPRFGLVGGRCAAGRFLRWREAQGGVSARASAHREHARCGCLSGMERSAMQRVPQRDRPPSIAAQFSQSENHRSMSPDAHRPLTSRRVHSAFL